MDVIEFVDKSDIMWFELCVKLVINNRLFFIG